MRWVRIRLGNKFMTQSEVVVPAVISACDIRSSQNYTQYPVSVLGDSSSYFSLATLSCTTVTVTNNGQICQLKQCYLHEISSPFAKKGNTFVMRLLYRMCRFCGVRVPHIEFLSIVPTQSLHDVTSPRTCLTYITEKECFFARSARFTICSAKFPTSVGQLPRVLIRRSHIG